MLMRPIGLADRLAISYRFWKTADGDVLIPRHCRRVGGTSARSGTKSEVFGLSLWAQKFGNMSTVAHAVTVANGSLQTSGSESSRFSAPVERVIVQVRKLELTKHNQQNTITRDLGWRDVH